VKESVTRAKIRRIGPLSLCAPFELSRKVLGSRFNLPHYFSFRPSIGFALYPDSIFFFAEPQLLFKHTQKNAV
jgi:hypothetical protein